MISRVHADGLRAIEQGMHDRVHQIHRTREQHQRRVQHDDRPRIVHAQVAVEVDASARVHAPPVQHRELDRGQDARSVDDRPERDRHLAAAADGR